MATDTAQVAMALRKDLQKAQALWSTEGKMRIGDKLVGGNVVSDTQSFIKMASFTNPGLPGPVGEREAAVEGRFDKVWDTTFSAQKYMMTVSFSREVWDDNQYRSIVVQNYGSILMDRCNDRREIVLQTEFFNEADTLTGPDGQFYGDSDHALDPEASELVASATASNIISPAGTVSTDLINKVYAAFMTEVDNKGVISPAVGRFDIECHPQRAMAWKQIKRGSEEPFTPERNTNPFSEVIGDIIPVPYATDVDRSAFKTSDHRRFVWDRKKPEITDLKYEKDDTYWANCVFRIGKGVFDWRRTIYSFG